MQTKCVFVTPHGECLISDTYDVVVLVMNEDEMTLFGVYFLLIERTKCPILSNPPLPFSLSVSVSAAEWCSWRGGGEGCSK